MELSWPNVVEVLPMAILQSKFRRQGGVLWCLGHGVLLNLSALAFVACRKVILPVRTSLRRPWHRAKLADQGLLF